MSEGNGRIIGPLEMENLEMMSKSFCRKAPDNFLSPEEVKAIREGLIIYKSKQKQMYSELILTCIFAVVAGFFFFILAVPTISPNDKMNVGTALVASLSVALPVFIFGMLSYHLSLFAFNSGNAYRIYDKWFRKYRFALMFENYYDEDKHFILDYLHEKLLHTKEVKNDRIWVLIIGFFGAVIPTVTMFVALFVFIG